MRVYDGACDARKPPDKIEKKRNCFRPVLSLPTFVYVVYVYVCKACMQYHFSLMRPLWNGLHNKQKETK